MPDVEHQLAHLGRGIDRIVPEDGLRARLEEGRPLRVKLGIDPTAPDVTLGWAVVFDLLRRFQEMGHVAVLIMGDFTAQVGDPSGVSATRRRLSREEVEGYAASCLEMVRPLLLAERLEVRYNSEWLAGMDMTDVLDLTGQVTVARILEREDFRTRLAENQPISMIELLYPLLQATDSVAVQADVELGGADQLWNLLVGRDLQERRGQAPQVAMTVPLLVGTDGVKKMSQSLGNYISVRDEPGEMFGKVMSIPDEVMSDYFLLATGIADAEIAALTSGLAEGELHPGDVKRRLGREIVARYWTAEAATEAEAAFDRVFRDRGVPAEVPEHRLPDEPVVWLPALLKEAGLVSSTSEARRLVDQGAVRVDDAPVAGEEIPTVDLAGRVVRVGKRRFVRFVSGR